MPQTAAPVEHKLLRPILSDDAAAVSDVFTSANSVTERQCGRPHSQRTRNVNYWPVFLRAADK